LLIELKSLDHDVWLFLSVQLCIYLCGYKGIACRVKGGIKLFFPLLLLAV
jgi:hypothetical protein